MVRIRANRDLRRASAIAAAALGLFAWSDARAQSADRALEFEDLGLSRRNEISARAASMSGFASVVNDVTALVYNPAGLCRIKQRTPLLGLAHESREIVTTYGENSTGLSSNRNALQFAGVAAAIPTFQGALVPAVAVYPVFVSDLNIAYQYDNAGDGRLDEFRIQQSGTTYAFALGFGIDLASVLSVGLSASFFEGGYHTLRQSHEHTLTTPTATDRFVIDDIDGDLDGMSGRIGLMLYAHRHAHIGINVTSPTLVDGAVRVSREETEVVENGTGSTTRTSIDEISEYVVPYRIDGSVAIPWGAFLVAVEAGTCDWSEAAIDTRRLRLQNGNAVLGRTTDVRAGIEWTAPSWPLRLRAGVARLPFAPRYLQADRIDNDDLEEVVSESVPIRYSLGAGVALKRTILIDAAFTHTRGERSSASFSEERTWSQIMIEGSYWF